MTDAGAADGLQGSCERLGHQGVAVGQSLGGARQVGTCGGRRSGARRSRFRIVSPSFGLVLRRPARRPPPVGRNLAPEERLSPDFRETRHNVSACLPTVARQRETTDPDGRLVVFDDRTASHLFRQRPQMLRVVDSILDTVHRPDLRLDDHASGRERFYRQDLDPSRWLRVVVDFNESPGFIVTALVQENRPEDAPS